MITDKEEIRPNVWNVHLGTGEQMTVYCKEGQTPEEVLAETEPE
ncbi:MAG: hypothetical protein ACRDDA_00435 [Aeromonas sp.]